jgi:5-formyltetrahydrofolate cyclo-ligase
VTSPPRAAAAKTALRARLLAARRGRPEEERAEAAAAVAAAVAAGLAEIGAGATVAGYVPDPIEPGHGFLPDALSGVAGRVLLPVVPATGAELGWAEFSGPLAVGRFGLLEPVGRRLPATALADAVAVVVPALAVGRNGARLGRGGGFYDRALRHAAAHAILVAVVFDDELLDEVPTEPHDLPMTAVVTPSGGWRPVNGTRAAPPLP